MATYICEPILRQGPVKEQRVLRPMEFTALVNAVPRRVQKVRFYLFLLTAARYAELVRLQYNKQWFDGSFIHFPEYKEKRKLRGQRDRYVHLSYTGRRIVDEWLNSGDRLPAYTNIDATIREAAVRAGVSPVSMSYRVFRKTYESWLIFTYPDRAISIFQSVGHTQGTAMDHYVNLGFTDRDLIEMREYTAGWQ